MCNWVGIQDTLETMTWRGVKGFGNATEEDWYVNGTLAGKWRTARNMTWVKVLEAGHMVSLKLNAAERFKLRLATNGQVPIDKPYAAHDLLLRFTGTEALAAAGDPSRIPSRIGEASNNAEAVIGKVLPDGGTLPAVISQQEQAAAAAASSAAAAVDLADLEGQPIDKERELMYGPRRTVVLVLIILSVTLAIYGLLRWRARQRRLKGWQPRSSLARQGMVHSQSYNRWNGGNSHGGTPTSAKGGKGKRPRESINMTEVNLLKRIEAHEEAASTDSLGNGVGTGEEETDDLARDIFSIEDEGE